MGTTTSTIEARQFTAMRPFGDAVLASTDVRPAIGSGQPVCAEASLIHAFPALDERTLGNHKAIELTNGQSYLWQPKQPGSRP